MEEVDGDQESLNRGGELEGVEESSDSKSGAVNGDVRRALTAVNVFVAQTVGFLNEFAQRCDTKLGRLQQKLRNVGMSSPSYILFLPYL